MTKIEPLLSIQVYNDPAVYRPGDVMRFDFQIDAIAANELTAVEASVIWLTEGKGDEDMGVHFFERRMPHDEPDRDLRALKTCHVVLPNSPLTYQGTVLQIRWCIRVRFFVVGGKELVIEKPIVLSATDTPHPARVLPHD